MDTQQARFNMIEQQIRTWEVLDQSVLNLLQTVRREDFVPAAYRSLAFVDMEIPIGEGQSMFTPKLEARIVQELGLAATDRVLEIGTGSGYLTALLASKAGHVTSIEIHPNLSAAAASSLATANIHNVHLKVGDAAQSPAAYLGVLDQFDAIVLTGSVPVLPAKFFDYLRDGGRYFAIVGDAPAMKACLITKSAVGAYATVELFETVVPPLVNAAQPSRFHF